MQSNTSEDDRGPSSGGSVPSSGGSVPSSGGRGPALECTGIRRSFQMGEHRIEILHGVSLELARGERLALMGTSGAGKTTLLNLLGLLDTPTEGTILIDGQNSASMNAKQRSTLRNLKIGFIFQFYHLLPELSALENALLPAMILHGSSAFRRRRAEFTDKAQTMLDRFSLGDRLKHRPSQLSGGEQQRVAIARALLLDPPILIADEPTGNLDRGTGEKVLELLLDEQQERGVSLLLVTHDERLAKRCDRVLYMEDGLIQADSSAPMPT